MPATSQPANFLYTSSAAPLPLPQLSSQTELTSTTQVTNISSEQELLACRSNAIKTPKKTLATHSADINEGQSSSGESRESSPLSELSDSEPGLITKPDGEPGRPKRGGYNIKDALGWPVKDYTKLQVSCTAEHCKTRTNLTNQKLVHRLVNEQLDITQTTTKQKSTAITAICIAVSLSASNHGHQLTTCIGDQ